MADLKNILSNLRQLAARAMFWRKTSTATDEPATTDEPAATTEAPPPEPAAAESASDARTETGEPKPGLVARLAARLTVWRRTTQTSSEAADSDGAPPAAPDAAPDAVPDGQEESARPSLVKRIAAILLKKSVWMPVAAILLIAVSTVTSITVMRAQQAGRDKALHSLQAEKQELEQENQKLRTQGTIIPAPIAHAAANPSQPDQNHPDPAFDLSSKPQPPARVTGGNDCIVSDKKNAGESLKRCIEAFNRVAGGQTRPRQ